MHVLDGDDASSAEFVLNDERLAGLLLQIVGVDADGDVRTGAGPIDDDHPDGLDRIGSGLRWRDDERQRCKQRPEQHLRTHMLFLYFSRRQPFAFTNRCRKL
jgi:hypothetical protein